MSITHTGGGARLGTITYLGNVRDTSSAETDVFTVSSTRVGAADYHASGFSSEDTDYSVGGFGSSDVSTFGVLEVIYCFAFGFTAGTNEDTIHLALAESGAPASTSAFTSISFVDQSSVSRTLNRVDSWEPDGTDETTRRSWAWSVSAANIMDDGGTYAVTLTV